MKRLCIILLGIVLLGISSCSDWLDVQPKTSIQAEDLFSTEGGFKDVLTGFYIKMGDNSLYAKNLTYGFLDFLACNYDNFPDISEDERYDYEAEKTAGLKNTVYLNMYNIIANINNFLSYLESNRSVITTEHYYEMMKGEALGLRAFLHFDLLRMFGPVYSTAPTEKSIAYRTGFDNEATPLLPANEVVGCILADLNEAEKLLEEHDTRLFTARDASNYNKLYEAFISRRQLRMNIFAVKAMLARVYCYMGDDESKEKAVAYAREVIEAPYWGLYNTYSNKILFGEFIFGLNVYELDKVIDQNFNSNPDIGNPVQHVYLTEDSFDALYEKSEGGSTDFRGSDGAWATKRQSNRNYRYSRKYEQGGYSDEEDGKNMVPLIRLPEMYYIVAECEKDREKSAEALNTVRWSRGISYDDEIRGDDAYDGLDTREGYDNAKTVRINEIMKEYRKEFLGEGLLFYYYKHQNYKTFYRCPVNDMSSHYKITIPDDEITFGNNQ